MSDQAANESPILIEQDGHIATITINRPKKLNALNEWVIRVLSKKLHELLQSDNQPRCAILTGAGKAFVAGADISAMAEMSVAEAKRFADMGHRLGNMMEAAPFPIIAAVNGFALGGGLELALACDFIYAAENAKLGLPEVTLAVIPGFGGTQRLTRRVGLGAARELIFTGRMIGAEEGLRLGIVNRVCASDELLAEAKKTAATIAKAGPLAIGAAKRVMYRGRDVELQTACELEAQAFASLFGTADQKTGMSAFLEKEPATFEGK